ncbi:MAG: hypothetical protein Q8P50_03940, partial [Bacillota bacterium]|nr:hypothetical protein [Bacillota bacterium]
MSLASLDTQVAAQQLREATLQEFPRVAALRERLRSLTIHELGYRQCLALAPVATDGGENRLSFDPLNIELIRVVDSEGREHVQKFIPLSEDASLIQRMFVEIPVLCTFLERIGVSYHDLSFFLPGNRRSPDPEGHTEEDLRKYVRSVRDIIEWAVLLDLAARSTGVRMLVIRDGLLRCKSMSIPAMK